MRLFISRNAQLEILKCGLEFDMKKIVINVFLLAFVHNLHALNITKSYYVSVTSVEPVIKTIKRYDASNVQTCREGNKLTEAIQNFRNITKIELSDMTYHLK